MSLKQRISYFAWGSVIVLLAGCIIAPIPLVQTEVQHPWSGRDAQGHDLAIEAEQKYWYLPVVAGPEGPKKMPTSSKCDYRYFLVQEGKKERVELSFLKLEGSEYSGWFIRDLPGSSYVLADRISSWEPENYTTRGSEAQPDIVRLDMIVFEGKELKHRRTLTAWSWPRGGTTTSLWSFFTRRADNHYVTYRTPAGFRRYDVWEDRDEPIKTGEESN